MEETLVFRTERKKSEEWEADRRLVVRFDPGNAGPLAQLGWRDRDRVESVIGFDADMGGFFGMRIDADGTSTAWRGRMVERLPDRTVQRFRAGDGEGLRLLVEDGGAPVERITWADRAGSGGAITLRSTGPMDTEITGRVRDVQAGDEYAAAGEVAANLIVEGPGKWLSRRRADVLRFTMAEPVIVRHYVLVSANDFSDRDPMDWELQASTDGRRWITLDTRSDENFRLRHLARGFDVTSPAAETPYRHFRLDIRANGGAHDIQLNHVRFFSGGPTYTAFSGHRYGAERPPAPYEGVAESGPAGALDTVAGWRTFLTEYSADMLRLLRGHELSGVTETQRAASWLGHDGAKEQDIAWAEERLGVRLPPSLRSFLAASDGWSTIGPFCRELRSTGTLRWLRDDEPAFAVDAEELEDEGVEGPTLLVSGDADSQYWVLDAGDVSDDGEWAAYVWANWYPGLGERHESFADLVVAERAAFEELKAQEHPADPEDADELLAAGRRSALRGEVAEALDAFRSAEEKGSGAAAYLKVVLSAFLDGRSVRRELARVLGGPRTAAEIGAEQLGAEAVPLFLSGASLDRGDDSAPEAGAAAVFDGAVPGLPSPSAPQDWAAWLADHRPPEPAAFEHALATARALSTAGAFDEAWSVIESALPAWYPLSPHRIAPVVLLTDPALRPVITPQRAREVVFTPRGEGQDSS